MARATRVANAAAAKDADFQWIGQRLQEAGFIVLVAVSLFAMVALLTFHETDPGWSRFGTITPIHNAGGQAGAWLADMAYSLCGVFAYLFPGLLLYIGLSLLYRKPRHEEIEPWLWCFRSMGFVCCLLAGSCLAQQHLSHWAHALPMGSGGILGQLLQVQALHFLGYWGSLVAMLALFLVGVTLTTGLSWFGLLDGLKKKNNLTTALAILGFFKEWRRLLFWRILSASKAKTTPKLSRPVLKTQHARSEPVIPPEMTGLAVARGEAFGETVTSDKIPIQDLLRARVSSQDLSDEPVSNSSQRLTNEHLPSAGLRNEDPLNVNPVAVNLMGASLTLSCQRGPASSQNQLPSVALLQETPQFTTSAQALSDAQLATVSRDIEDRLQEFGIQAQVVAAYPGPVITRFELEPAAGVKVSRIVGLAKDLARALLVSRVRVVEVIPGKSVIGIEIPNPDRELVSLRSVLESEAYQSAVGPLTLALGKDISGEPVVVNLAKMPHLLVAGTTGSGKSVGVNAMLLSLLYKASPESLRLILIDPKMLELSIYEGIPHLLAPVVTDMKDAAQALRWCVAEMERRYQQMASLGVRHLEGFNQKLEEAALAGEVLYDAVTLKTGDPEQLVKLPYIVVIIDEFADMMMVVGKKVEELIARIAQKARAAGIHLILATQRPSVDVITGLIKANIPTRIAFQVSSRIDSRTILDQQGAEQLLGYGDMLYLPPGTGIPLRVHGAFVSDEEVHTVVAELKRYGAPDYVMDILGGSSFLGTDGLGEVEGESDALYDEAVKIVVDTRRASASHLQRRLKIGYNRAARLIEAMEAAGLVSTLQSGGNREVMVAE